MSSLALRYPIGNPPEPGSISRQQALANIAELPSRLAEVLSGLDPAQLDTPYRDDGWTLRQVAHHVADSHVNAYTRLRLALTEYWPVIKPYDEALWADLEDVRTLPVEVSLALLIPLHTRWITLLHSLNEEQWQRGYIHPQNGRTTLDAMTVLYSWHGRHHTAHVAGLRVRKSW